MLLIVLGFFYFYYVLNVLNVFFRSIQSLDILAQNHLKLQITVHHRVPPYHLRTPSRTNPQNIQTKIPHLRRRTSHHRRCSSTHNFLLPQHVWLLHISRNHPANKLIRIRTSHSKYMVCACTHNGSTAVMLPCKGFEPFLT